MQYFVPSPIPLSDDPEDETTLNDAWQFVFPVVGWTQDREEVPHEGVDGEVHMGTIVVGYPMILVPDRDGGHEAPARVWFGEGLVFTSPREAKMRARSLLKQALEEHGMLAALEESLGN